MNDVGRATSERVSGICEMLTRAFANDPMMTWPLGEVDDLACVQQRLFELIDVPLAELGLLWEIGDAAAAALWIPPSSFEDYINIEMVTRPAVRALTSDNGRRWEAMWDLIEDRIPDEPLWFLDHVGVDPMHQGSGLGRSLVEHGLALARADGIGAFLETAVERNVAYYQRLGFKTVEEAVVPLGGPHIWFMRQDP